jgi:adenylate cyclase
MGDCIMAFWNAPLDDPMHAAHACRSALAMQESLKELNAHIAAAAESPEHAFMIKAGVGLNTGNCVVGNMGSEQRFDYSVLGDDVNLASRLEGQSKTYGADILIGENTRAAAPDFAALEVDLIAVKGRAAAVTVYALLGDIGVRDSEIFQQLTESQGKLLSAYRKRDWDGARDHVGRCRNLALNEWKLGPLYDLYDDRIANYLTVPPPDDWTGVYVAETK